MSTTHKTPILTSIFYICGIATLASGIVGGVVICIVDSFTEGIVLAFASFFAGIIYIGIGQAVDFLARTAQSTDRLCTILETSITERLRAIETSSLPPVSPTTLPGSTVKYYYSTDGEQQGPVDGNDLRLMRKDGLITDDTPVLREGESQ